MEYFTQATRHNTTHRINSL